MKLLLDMYAEYKKTKLLGWLNKHLEWAKEPRKRLKILEVKQKVLGLKKPTLSQIKVLENMFTQVI